MSHCVDVEVENLEEQFSYTTTPTYTLLDRCLKESYTLFTQVNIPDREFDSLKSILIALIFGRIISRLGQTT